MSFMDSHQGMNPLVSMLGHESSRVHVMSFMDSVLDSGCTYQPPPHEIGCNAGTPMSFDTVLERPIWKENARDTRLAMLIHATW